MQGNEQITINKCSAFALRWHEEQEEWRINLSTANPKAATRHRFPHVIQIQMYLSHLTVPNTLTNSILGNKTKGTCEENNTEFIKIVSKTIWCSPIVSVVDFASINPLYQSKCNTVSWTMLITPMDKLTENCVRKSDNKDGLKLVDRCVLIAEDQYKRLGSD